MEDYTPPPINYSPSTGCFYPLHIEYAALPNDVIEVPQSDFEAAMARNYGDTLTIVDGRIVVVPAPALTTDEIVASVWGKIKAERDCRRIGGVKIGDKWFHSDDTSRIQQMGLVMLGANMSPTLQWKTLDGSFVSMTPALAQQIFNAIAVSDQTIFSVAETHLAALKTSADPVNYDYSTGWPAVYGE